MAGMVTAQELLNAYHLGRKSVYQAVSGISQEDFIWKPADNVKSMQQLLVHLGGAERFWLSKLGRDALDYPQDDALKNTIEYLKDMENLLTRYVEEAPEQLDDEVSTDRGKLSLAWVIKRVTQHMFYHLGTFVYLRSIRQPEWEGDAGLTYWQTAVDAFSALVRTER